MHHLQQGGTQVAEGEGGADGRLVALQQRDGVEEEQLTRDHQHQEDPRRLGVQPWETQGGGGGGN